MRDIFGREILIGDVVAVNPPYYKGLAKAKVIRFGKVMVTVQYTPEGKQTYDTFPTYPGDICICLEKRPE